MATRLTHVPLELVDHVSGFIASRDTLLEHSVLVRTHNCSTLSLIKMLHAIRSKPLCFSEFFKHSEIRLKRSFLGYLSVCMRHEFITKSRTSLYSMYTITPKGMQVLDLFTQ